MRKFRFWYWIIMLFVGIGLYILLKKGIFLEWMGFSWTIWVLVCLSSFTFERSLKKSRISPVIAAGVAALFSIWINNSVTPLVSATISNMAIKTSSIYGNRQNFYLKQEAEYEIKFPLIPLVNFVITPLNESTELFPTIDRGEFGNYEINPYIKNVDIHNNKVLINIRRLSSLLIQDTKIDIIFKRQFKKKLKFDFSVAWQVTDKDGVLVTLKSRNDYRFVIKNLIYEEQNFVNQCGVLTSQFFLDTTKYKQGHILKEGSTGYAEIDKDGNLQIIVLSPVDAGEEMNFFITFEKVKDNISEEEEQEYNINNKE